MTLYPEQWRDYRWRHWSAVVGLLFGLPTAFFIAYALSHHFNLKIDTALLIVIPVWAALWLWLALRVTRFPCPSCGAPFNSSHRCCHCGLWLYEQAPPNDPPTDPTDQ